MRPRSPEPAEWECRCGCSRCFEIEPPPDFPLRDLENVVFTPHLGASTAEAQENIGIEIAQAIRAALLEGEIRNAVNMPSMDAKTAAIVKPYLTLGDKLGALPRNLHPIETIESLSPMEAKLWSCLPMMR